MGKLRICVVGAGSIGRRHIRLLSERTDTELSVVEPYEPGWERVQREIGTFRRFASLEEAIASGDVDAAVIATPHPMHAKIVLPALAAGLHVFCEKPMSDSLEECVAMLNAAERSDKVFSVGFMFHFDPFVQEVRRVMASGEIGTPLHFSSRFATYITLMNSVTRYQAHTPYSVIMDCIHDTDLLCWMSGRVPDRVFVNGIQAGDLELSSDPNFIDAVYRWDDGSFAARAHFNYVQYPQVHTLEVVGDRGYIQGDFMSARILVAGEDGQVKTYSMERDFDNVYRAEWDAFIGAVRGEREPENPAGSAILPTLLMQAQKESAMSGREVNIRSVAERYGFRY